MSSVALEWLFVFMFFLFAFGLTFAEAIWLSKNNWAAFGKALGFTVTTNVIGFFIGFAVIFVVFVILLMLVFDNSINNLPHGDLSIIVALVFAALFFPLILALCKRLFLRIFKMQAGKPAWLFSLASAFTLAFLSLVVPIIAGYLLF
jgi:hypothetical protein